MLKCPLDSKTKAHVGKRRLLYEANPTSLIVEQAGGAYTTGRERTGLCYDFVIDADRHRELSALLSPFLLVGSGGHRGYCSRGMPSPTHT